MILDRDLHLPVFPWDLPLYLIFSGTRHQPFIFLFWNSHFCSYLSGNLLYCAGWFCAGFACINCVFSVFKVHPSFPFWVYFSVILDMFLLSGYLNFGVPWCWVVVVVGVAFEGDPSALWFIIFRGGAPCFRLPFARAIFFFFIFFWFRVRDWRQWIICWFWEVGTPCDLQG